MREDPDDHNDSGNGNDAPAGKFKWHAIAADVTATQHERGEATKSVEQKHRHIREDGEFLKGRAEGKRKCDGRISDDRNVGRAKSRMHPRKPFRNETISTKSKNNPRRTQDIARRPSEGRNGKADQHQRSPGAPQKSGSGFG